ncbi:hypothetical protein ACGF0D_25660 [Kitasatospora sp. NPDC048298]|uniref:hypothetical protein n=1 Tax=Kitasatospora sp. NPDC048298 TaxID=3364049 RepID=UPI00371F2B97
MAPDYRVIYAEFHSGEVWGELAVTELSYSLEANSAGPASVKVPLTLFDWSALRPWRVLVYIQRGQQIVWGGPLVAFSLDLENEEAELHCLGLWEYYRRRQITYDAIFVQRDQGAIVQTLLQDFADGTGQYTWNSGPRALTFDSSAVTGILRDRTYRAYERKMVGKAVEDMAGVRDGFDFRIDHAWFGGRIVNTVRFSPPSGTPTDLTLEHGANCDIPSATVDGTNMVTEAVVTGGGEAESQLAAWWYNLPAERDPSRRIPRLSAVQSRQDVIRGDTLTAYAQQVIAEGSTPISIPAVRLYPGTDPGPGDVVPGVQVRARARVGGRLVLDGAYKVTTIGVRLADGGEETTLTLVPGEVFGNVGSAASP